MDNEEQISNRSLRAIADAGIIIRPAIDGPYHCSGGLVSATAIWVVTLFTMGLLATLAVLRGVPQ